MLLCWLLREEVRPQGLSGCNPPQWSRSLKMMVGNCPSSTDSVPTWPVWGLALVLEVGPPHCHGDDVLVPLLAGVDISDLYHVNLGLKISNFRAFSSIWESWLTSFRILRTLSVLVDLVMEEISRTTHSDMVVRSLSSFCWSFEVI